MRALLIVMIICIGVVTPALAQHSVTGTVVGVDGPVSYAKVKIKSLKAFAVTDEKGGFELPNLPAGKVELEVFSYGFEIYTATITIPSAKLKVKLESSDQQLEEMVVSGTLKEVSKKESTVNVEVYSEAFFKKNPTPSVFEALQNINGVRPQLNCNICNTGDIHINGLEGPYTMVLIDGMPIVSSLSTVYGLSGIPNSLIDRIEIVKGPASTLYGSEAIGGIINIITRNPLNAPIFSVDVHTTSWLETNADIAGTFTVGKKATVLTGINYFNYDLKHDDNNDGFTDVTLQDRLSVFQKWNFQRKDYRLFTVAARYLYEDRWGGEMDWNSEHRGGDSIYGESIYTARWELIGKYQLPLKEKIYFSTSINHHDQNSYYGSTSFMAQQLIAFGQLHWDKKIGRHDFTLGAATRYVNYDDDTPATAVYDTLNPTNQPSISWLPGAFVQDEIRLNEKHKILAGMRYDYNTAHGSIFTPRLGYKWLINDNNVLRLNTGTGYRIVNIFTEDHAALTGAREVIIDGDISPEQSYNANLNFNKSIYTKKNRFIGIDFTAFYTYFTNRIIADYETDPDEIHYANLNSYAISQGVSAKVDLIILRELKIQVGGTYMDIASYDGGIKKQQMLTENFSGNWSVSYTLPKAKLVFDYTGNVYSPMKLPVLNEMDPRPDKSPWWSLQNIQITYKGIKKVEIYGGVKNLLNWTPNKGIPFLIAGSNDPFDQQVLFDANGDAVPTANNPYGLTFDPAYVYAPNQGIRGFLGVRYLLE